MTPRRGPQYLLGVVACVVGLLMVWQWAARGQSSVVLPTPVDTLAALGRIIGDGSLATELALTLGRAALATTLAFGFGVLLGWGEYRSVFVAGLTAPVRAVLQGLPPIVLIVVLVLWMGSDPAITIIVVSTVMAPVIAASTASALKCVDPLLRELGPALQLSRARRGLLILAPAALPPVLATTGAVASGAVRVTVMAELLSAPDGVGAAIAQNRTLLQTPELFAWTAAIVVSALAVDLAIRAVLRRVTPPTAEAAAAVSPRSRPGIQTR